MSVIIKHHHQTTKPNDATKDVSSAAWNEEHDVVGLGDLAEKDTADLGSLAVVDDAPSDGNPYLRKNAAWVQGLIDAASDGKIYARKNAAWAEISSGTPTITEKNANYVMGDVVGTEIVKVTTAGALIIVTLPTLVDNQGSRVIVLKDKDSGVGEVLTDGEGAEILVFPGGSATGLYLGLAGQYHALIGMVDGWHCIGGSVQRVASQPCLGKLYPTTGVETAWEYSNTAPTASTFYTVTFTKCPAGATGVVCFVRIMGVAGSPDSMRWRPYGSADTYANSFHRKIVEVASGLDAPTDGSQVMIPVDSSFRVQVAVGNGESDIYVGKPQMYFFG